LVAPDYAAICDTERTAASDYSWSKSREEVRGFGSPDRTRQLLVHRPRVFPDNLPEDYGTSCTASANRRPADSADVSGHPDLHEAVRGAFCPRSAGIVL